MKVNKTISALSLSLGMAVAAQAANTPVYITGSTAFRGQIFNALANDMHLTANSGDAGGNNSFTFTGTPSDVNSVGLDSTVTSTPVNVYCTFSGSAEGTQALINGTTQVNNYESVGGGTFNHAGVDLAFSDVQQAVEPDANETQLTALQTPCDSQNPPFNGIAVQPFCFIANSNAATAGVSNMDSAHFTALYAGGSVFAGAGTLPLGFFNNSAPSTNVVYAVGRYNLSGTRITAILDDGYDLSVGLNQYALATNANAPAGVASTDHASPGGNNWVQLTQVDANGFPTNGYFSGGNVGTAIHQSSLNNVPPAVGYISFSDATGKTDAAKGDAALLWNGEYAGSLTNSITHAPAAWNIAGVENGSYQFWSYEQLYVAPGEETTFVGAHFGPGLILALQYEITHTTPRTACLESEMNVYRNGDGAPILPGTYTPCN